MAEQEYTDETAEVTETVRLKEGLLLKELVEKMNTEFTLDASELDDGGEKEFERRVDTFYDFKDFEPHVNLDCVQTGEGDGDSANKTPFGLLREQMTNVTGDGKVKKRVKRMGSGSIVPENSVIYIHYNAYLEMEEVPFDTSYLRTTKPLRFQLGKGNMYAGFELAVATMRKNEKSQFLVEPEYAFGKMGVPPRIPPNAAILLELEMINFVDCGDATLAGEEAAPGENKRQFANAYKTAKSFHVLANDYFGNKNIPAAVENYRKAERLLTSCFMSSDEEERDQKKLLMKIYVNLCICYNDNRMRMPQKVCIAARDAVFVSPKDARNNAKLQYNWGKALLALNDFKRAGEHLRLALKAEPNNQETSKLLQTLEKKEKAYHEQEKICYRRALQLDKKSVPSKKETKSDAGSWDGDDFTAMVREQLSEFKAGQSGRIQLPSGLTKEEREVARSVAEGLGLCYQEQESAGGGCLGSTVVTVFRPGT